MAGFNWRSLFYLLFGFLLAFSLPTGALAILIGLLFVRIETRYGLFFSLGSFVIGTLAGTFAWGKSWIFEALEQGVWGFVGGLVVILGLSLILALLLSLLKGKGGGEPS
ncbi:hypothetical protein [Thermococcus henrietii]|uniref:hypothetical protein n=1 Tax=Thermococcus henrietii TaxID=2016361 RepID=UPI000C06A5C8|nr:hypothetical protein [Thermococcus henrietii]